MRIVGAGPSGRQCNPGHDRPRRFRGHCALSAEGKKQQRLARVWAQLAHGTPVEAGGRLVDPVERALRGCAADPCCAALEVTEYNPQHDVGGRTAQAAFALLAAMRQGERDTVPASEDCSPCLA